MKKIAFIVFSKAPIEGKVKSRLIPDLGQKQATLIYIELLQHVLSNVFKWEKSDIQLWCSPDTQHGFFQECVDVWQVDLFQQQGADLGERMYHAMHSALKTHQQVFIVGGDCPSLNAKDFELASQKLENDVSVVIAPAEDGGYVMMALNKITPEIFEQIEWGTAKVMAQTRQQLTKSQLSWFELPLHWDVDYPEDVVRFKKIFSR